MKAILTSIKDELSEFSTPIPILINEEAQKDATIKRFFRQYVTEHSYMANNPEDFSIWIVGEFDTNTAEVTGKTFPELVERAQGKPNGNKEN